jgi:hypothetical protein
VYCTSPLIVVDQGLLHDSTLPGLVLDFYVPKSCL